jgi:hypothetical protein
VWFLGSRQGAQPGRLTADTRHDEETTVGLPSELVREVRRLDEYELRRLAILVRGLLLHVDGDPGPAEDHLPPTLRYRQQHVRCGKPSCTSCPHGPYWYALWKEDGRTRKRYIGRQLPGEALEPVVPDGAETGGPRATPDPPRTEGAGDERR